MTIGDGAFDIEDLKYLRSLAAVKSVTHGRIRYTEEFKHECMRRYREGESPASIFREAGLDSALIGYKRIERCIARWKREYGLDKVKAFSRARNDHDDTPSGAEHPSSSQEQWKGARRGDMFPFQGRGFDIRDRLIVQQVNRIEELEDEVAYLKEKIASLDTFDEYPEHGPDDNRDR